MDYRKALIVALVAERGRTVDRLELDMFVVSRRLSGISEQRLYDFFSYKGLPRSEALRKDLGKLIEASLLRCDGNDVMLRIASTKAHSRFLDEQARSLMRDVSQHYEYYTDAKFAEQIRTEYPEFAEERRKQRPNNRKIFTIGYQGRSIDLFLDSLQKNRIELIADLRNNPISRVWGFSRGTLIEKAALVGIRYLHLPEFGVPRSWRQKLEERLSVITMLREYERLRLPRLTSAIEELGKLAREFRTVLLCREQDLLLCHRFIVARSLAARLKMPVVHI